jgi:hypothetical protein
MLNSDVVNASIVTCRHSGFQRDRSRRASSDFRSPQRLEFLPRLLVCTGSFVCVPAHLLSPANPAAARSSQSKERE